MSKTKKQLTEAQVERRKEIIDTLKSMIFPTVLCLIILVGVLFVVNYQGVEEEADLVQPYAYAEDKASYVLENDDLKLTLDPETTHPVIALMPEQNGVENLGGTLRLGSYPCVLGDDTKAIKLYGSKNISERHRHRYEVNNEYREELEGAGMSLSGISPDGRIVEMIEIKDHPYFLATQAHPEFKSRPDAAHPLFRGLIEAALDYKKN